MLDFFPLYEMAPQFSHLIECPSERYAQITYPTPFAPYVFMKTGKYEGYFFYAGDSVMPIYIECAIQEAYPIEIDWDTPIYRQNGTPLRESEIYAYQVCYSNIDVDVTECEQFRGVNSATLTVYDAGDWVISISTIDTDGLIGFSESYRVSI